MTAQEFVVWVKENAARVTEYSNGGDGSGGKCDCIGLVIGAWRLSGNTWSWIHGSNFAARYLTDNLGKDKPLNLGDLVYKARPPGEPGYDLPERYSEHADMNDYYHVGVVTGTDPLIITHCTSVRGGIKIDTERGKWHYSGQFSKLAKGVQPVGEIMTVWSANGKPVNLRNSFSTAATIIKQVPCGATVEVIEAVNDKWAKVRFLDKTGYMMREYLKATGDPTALEYLKQAQELITKAIEVMGQ